MVASEARGSSGRDGNGEGLWVKGGLHHEEHKQLEEIGDGYYELKIDLIHNSKQLQGAEMARIGQ